MSMSDYDAHSDAYANVHYLYLLACPPLIARTGTIPWDRKPSALGPVRHHALCKIWEEDGLARKTSDLLESREVKYASVDIVHAGSDSEEEEEEERPLPVILWISVTRGSLSRDDGLVAAHKCKALLEEHGVTDVEVEIREWYFS
jgi:hypothetical protein